MFYFLLAPILTYNWILIVAAVVPAVFLMVKVYRSDRLEKESPEMIGRLVIAGILSTLLAMVEERIGSSVLAMFFSEATTAYNVLLYFVVVGLAEESSKYLLMKRRTWSSQEFNCQYDGVVYAVFVSLGFALWENISYVLHYGFSTALVRAVTAIPGHACFGVFMGVFYGLARSYAFLGDQEKSRLFRVLAVLVPMLLHGAYDYIASSRDSGTLTFILFIAVLFTLAFSLVSRMSKNDRYFRMDRRNFHF
ncbi:MAG: PrsW family intramembrane metalloprotease [Oscillospiraceae bacterium]|nr:PrsW family intramembrane metalloprotease [Oscillospiraceae bacterium]